MPPQKTYDTKKIIILGLILLAIVAIIAYFILKKNNRLPDILQRSNLFPFTNTTTPPGAGSATGTETIENPITTTPLISTTSERLRVVANYPVTSYFPSLKNKTITEPQFNEATNQTIQVSKTIPVHTIRFNARQNGFIVDAEVSKNIITIAQKTETPIPNAQELWFTNQGNTLTYRSWDQQQLAITSFIGSLPNTTPLDYCQKPFTASLKISSKGDEVKEFQKYINRKLLLNLVVDGAFGKKAADAIKPLQEKLGITPTGTYTNDLIAAMNTDCAVINETFNATLSGTQKLTGDFIENGILRGDVSPDGTKIFFLKPTRTGVVGIITDALGKNPRQVFESSLSEWRPQWINATTIAMTTLASSEADGYLYFLNPVTGDFQKKIGPVRGLTTLVNPSGTSVLLSQSANKRLVTSVYDLGTGDIRRLDLTTLPEKCTWQNDAIVYCAVPATIQTGQYPDDWYQGNTTFSDAFWSIDLLSRATDLIVSPSKSFDAYQLRLNPNGTYLYFINRLDSSLWSYRIGDE